MSVPVLQTRRFWIIFLAAALLSAIAAFALMFTYVPLLKVDIHFSRAEAVAAAAKFQQQQFPELQTNRTAASFVSDRDLQNYVELEGGGLAAYKAIINNLDAVTHYWKVRNFAESQEQELITAYSPKGEPISYFLKLPEQAPGAALDEAAARTLAEAGARAFMGERFAAYQAFDTKTKRQTSGRMDYSFTYEHSSLKVGEARFRLELTVAGDKLVGLDTLTHIPEAFQQRFNGMRSINNQISQIANYFMMGLLGLGGLVGGGIWLHRRHQLQWRRALLPAVIVASGLAMAGLCNLPMAWMGYNTTVSANNFVLQQLATAAITLVASALFFSIVYAVAEGLSRMAFADHPRLFDFFRRPVAASPEAMGRILGGYGWAGFFLLYAMVFIVFSSQVLGWWQPTDMESDPNVLASWRPALGPIFTALQAGTWEECLFRAVPLALAAIIGKHFGIRTPLVIIALVLQALIFGGAHANYPNMPGYSRLVELFIPALAFGLVYLRFGLVVGMLTHFVYDLVLMSLPIFFASDSSLLLDKALVVLAGSAPLLVLLWARYRAGAALPLASEWRNGIASVQAEPQPIPTDVLPTVNATPLAAGPLPSIKLNPKLLALFAVLGLVALLVSWVKARDIIWPQLQVNRAQAQQLAQAELAKRGVVLNGEWHQTLYVGQGLAQAREFVWRDSGKGSVQNLLGKYLDTAYWEVHWRKFDGPVEQRTEQWIVLLRPDGSLYDLVHDLPEAAPGAKLTREQATSVAMQWVVAHQWAEVNQLEEKSVEETVRPNRSDWRVTFNNNSAFAHNNATAIITITLSGDEVTASLRSVAVPEEWQRAEAQQQSQKMPFSIARGVVFFALILLVLSTYLRKHQGRKMHVWIAMPWVVITCVAMAVDAALWLDPITANFQTTTSWATQFGQVLVERLILMVVISIFSLIALQAVYAERPLAHASAGKDFMLGAALALALGGLNALLTLVIPSTELPPLNTADYAAYVPWLATSVNGIKSNFVMIAMLILAIGAVRFSQTRLKFGLLAGLALLWWLLTALAAREVGLVLATQGAVLLSLGVLVWLVSRQQLGVAIALLGVGTALHRADIVNAIYPYAWLHALVAGVFVVAMSYGLVWHWHRKNIASGY